MITDLSTVESGDIVLLVDVDNQRALSYENNFLGINVTINDDGSIDDNAPQEYIKWKVTKSDDGMGNPQFSFEQLDYIGPLYGYTLGTLSFDGTLPSDSEGDRSSNFKFDDYGENGGYLGFMFGNYIGWDNSTGNYRGKIGGSTARFTLYKRDYKNYVKWKRVVNGNFVKTDNNIVVVVEQNSEKALGNDKEDKDPDAVAVTLNDEKDRIVMDEVPEKVQWTFNRNKNQGAWFTTKDGKHLYADTSKDDPVLRVGEGNDLAMYFDYGTTDSYYESLWISKGEGSDKKSYLFSVDDSMFSNVWKLKETTDDFSENHLFYYQKVVSPQKVVTIDMAEYWSHTYTGNQNLDKILIVAEITGALPTEATWTSSNTSVATVDSYGVVTPKQRGSVVITVSIPETTYHDKASAKCTVIFDDQTTETPGSMKNPFTVADAKELAEKGKVTVNGTTINWKEGVYYYIKGKVCKVNSGMMAMFGDMDFDSMGSMGGGNSSFNFEDSMDDMDFDPEDMEESGFDMSSMGFDMSSLGFDMSAMFGTSDKVTYYISDDGVKDKEKQLKVLNGCGTLKSGSSVQMEFNPIPKLSPGDCVIVCGPLVYTEDESMFSSFMGGGDDEKTWKVGESNYLYNYDPTLLIKEPEPKEVYVEETLNCGEGGMYGGEIYEIDNFWQKLQQIKITNDMLLETSFKSSDEEIAKWDEENKQIVGVNVGKAKITVKVKVIVTQDDPATDDNEERSYTMKRKFKLIVKTRDLDPAGYYEGDYVLTTSTNDLENGTRLILIGTRVKDEKETDYVMVQNNAMMGGGKNGSKIDFEDPNKERIACSVIVPKGGLEVVLEKAEDDTSWYLNVGTDENNTPLYLYASDTSEDEEEGQEGEEGQNENQFDMKKMMDMFGSGSGLKVGTKDEVGVDSLKATISFEGNIATIKYTATEGKNNTIMLSSSFDMEEMMNMFSSTGEGQGEGGSGNTFDMGSFDMFMAAFNTKKPGDEKSFMPRIYRFVPYPTFDISIGTTDWKTIVTYENVAIPETVEAYVVTKVGESEDGGWAKLTEVESRQLKGGEPYLLHRISGNGGYTLTVLDPEVVEVSAPEKNLLQVSNKLTAGVHDNTSVYVLANKSAGVGFYRWTGGLLGAGRVYLPVEAFVAGANEFCAFNFDQTTAIESIEDSKANVGPFYDLQGRRVQPQQKGIYINNGKKVVVK